MIPLRRHRICHVNLSRGFRGGERQTSLLIDRLAAIGWPQRLVTRRGSRLASLCSEVSDLEIRTASSPVAAAWAARGTALAHAHEARAVYACWLLNRLGGAPYLLTRRVDNPFGPSFLRDRAYRAAARVVAVSRAVAALIEARYGEDSTAMIADAHADLAAGHTLPPAMRGRYGGKTVIGHVGALDHGHKGQRTIVEAARRAAAARPDWHFVLVGSGRDEQMLRVAAAGLSNLEFAGEVENVADWFAVFDVFVYPSLHEGLGSSLLDAMAFGLPIVATRVGGIPEIVEDGVNGLLIEPEDPEALEHAIARLVDDSMLSDRLRGNALDTAARHGPETMVRAYAALYESILAE